MKCLVEGCKNKDFNVLGYYLVAVDRAAKVQGEGLDSYLCEWCKASLTDHPPGYDNHVQNLMIQRAVSEKLN